MLKDKVIVGQVRSTKEGGSFTVIEFHSAINVIIRHNDKHGHIAKVSASQVRSGNIRNPYYPTLHGVAYMGVGEHKAKIKGKHVQTYSIWSGAVMRCYCPVRLAKRPSYEGCTLSNDWLCYQNFAEWYVSHESYGLGYELDKDLLFKGNKVYSAETCCLLPREINLLIRDSRTKESDLPIGVLKSPNGNFTANVKYKGNDNYLGTFITLEEASSAYTGYKEQLVKEVALEWKGKIEPRAFDALMNWTVY